MPTALTPREDAPLCPGCAYQLTGLMSSRCPECGKELGHDLSIYIPKNGSTPWSRNRSLPLYCGIWQSLRHPVKTLALSDADDRISTWRAFFFAVMCLAPVAVLWWAIRETGCATAYAFSSRPSHDRLALFRKALPGELRSLSGYVYMARWEAFSMAHWVLLFVLLAYLPLRGWRLSFLPRMRMVMLFAPWIAALELLHLIAVWLVDQNVVPEPSTMWILSFTEWRDVFSSDTTIVRMLIAIAPIVILFLKAGLRWRIFIAIPIGVALAPVIAILTSYWVDLCAAIFFGR